MLFLKWYWPAIYKKPPKKRIINEFIKISLKEDSPDDGIKKEFLKKGGSWFSHVSL